MKYGLIGERLSHSYSKTIHGLLGNNEYELLELSRDQLEAFLLSQNFSGVNVTIPYKRDVMSYCELSRQACRIGSVNTILCRDGKLFGHNTDYNGFAYMAHKAGLSFAGKKVLILGSGGTAKTAFCVATDHGAEDIISVSRTGDIRYDQIERHCDIDILINTTPVGMYPKNGTKPVELEQFHHLEGVLDVVYNPLKTQLLLSAEKRRIRCAGGLSMLVSQAVYAHNLFFNLENSRQSDEVLIEDILTRTSRLFRNIIFIGMPGSGKTTIGSLLAARLGLPFVDTDECIHTRMGQTPADMIATHGEDYFRKAESEVIYEITKQTGQVIATGGGSVILPANRDALQQNGYIIYLDRGLDQLATDGRPLSRDIGTVQHLYEKRSPIYQMLCDLSVTVTGEPEAVTQSILKELS